MIFLGKNKKIFLIATIGLILIVIAIVVTIKVNGNVNSEEKAVITDFNEVSSDSRGVDVKKESNSEDEEKKSEETSNKEDATKVLSVIPSNTDTQITNNTESKASESSPSSNNQNPTKQTTKVESKNNSEETITIQGYLIDEDCFVCYPDPAKETLGCLIMPECAASGYGIAFLRSGKYNFYFFDGNISTYSSGKRISNANGGQQLGWDFINTYVETNNIPVKVTGQLTKETRCNPDPLTADNRYYSIFKVSSITE